MTACHATETKLSRAVRPPSKPRQGFPDYQKHMAGVAHVQADALDVVVVVEDGVAPRGRAVGGDGAAVEDAVAVPEHLQALAEVAEALRLRVHRAAAVGRPAHAPASHATRRMYQSKLNSSLLHVTQQPINAFRRRIDVDMMTAAPSLLQESEHTPDMEGESSRLGHARDTLELIDLQRELVTMYSRSHLERDQAEAYR